MKRSRFTEEHIIGMLKEHEVPVAELCRKRQDFFLARRFRNLEDMNVNWLDTVANARLHGTTQRIVAEAFAAEQSELQTLPEHPFGAVLKLERRVSHDGFVAIGGNYYSVPDRTRRVVEVQQMAAWLEGDPTHLTAPSRL